MITGFPTLSGTVDKVFIFIAAISLILLVLVTVTMIYFVIRYSRDKNPDPQDIEGNFLLEVAWTLIPTILVLAMFYYGYAGFKYMRDVPKNAMIIKVTARQWSWLFEYESGKTSGELTVPLGKPVKLVMTSKDVLHSLFIPAFRVKEDTVPGQETYLWFVADAEGSFDLFCAEYCGVAHSAMMSKVNVILPEKFSRWLEEDAKVAKGETAEGPKEKVSGEKGASLASEKGCIGCHSVDGSSLVGPSFKGIYNRKTTVITDGKEREVISDEEYLKRSILNPGADIVKGYPPIMPSQEGALTDRELEEMVEYLKTLN
jgi:cytochrome c oxidase subunit 2